MGNEIKRDMCPKKYCAESSVFKESIPTLIASIIVAFYSGNLFNASGMNIAITILIEVVVVGLIYGVVFTMLKKMKARWAETYISVCENGVCGVCPLNGFKNKNYELYYQDITKMVVKGERLFLYSKKGNVALTLSDATGTAALIKSKNVNL